MNCRQWTIAALVVVLPLLLAAKPKQPNVLIVITDDQGYGDLGCHGNPVIHTPNLDRFAKESTQLRQFYVSPVCSPTRSSLMTGRYNYRTGVVDTFVGRAMMHPDETTIADVLSSHGYRTGIFGKWHLGDNYPLRPQEHGFQECVVLKGGGIGQSSDLPDGKSYFDPVLLHNGKIEKRQGYISDVLTDAAIEFVSKKADKPFFAYLAFNCPHDPLQVGDDDLKRYRGVDLSAGAFPKQGFPLKGKINEADVAKIYAMVSNIDANLGRLFKKLDENKLTEETLVIFLTDNGPAQLRYNSGFRGLKASVYEGGVRAPFYARWPATIPAGKGIDAPAAHIDILPTVLEACGAPLPNKRKIDGISVLPALKGDRFNPPERTIYLQWHRGDAPELGRACMARGPRFKLVQPQGVAEGKRPKKSEFELYDLVDDPWEQKDLAASKPEIAVAMRKGYEEWFADVEKERHFLPPRIVLGSEHENPSILTHQDWRGPDVHRGKSSNGHWEVSVARAGTYRVTLHVQAAKHERLGRVELGVAAKEMTIPANQTRVVLDGIQWKQGEGRLTGYVVSDRQHVGADYLEVERVGE